MEWKIGEIRQINGEWYQCVIGGDCNCCGLLENGICVSDFSLNGSCFSIPREDKTSVIFKKLEKAGEPYEYYLGTGIIMVQEYILANANYIWEYSQDVVVVDCQNGKVAIETKQNKEDMEEKYSELTGIVHEYMEKDMTYKDFKEAIDYWVDDYIANKSVNNSNLKPFSLEAAKAGKPVCTRDGRKARIISCSLRNKNFPIAAIVEDEEENVYQFEANGVCDEHDENLDLMMLPEKKEGWVNLYKSSAHPSKEEAMKYRNKCNDYIDTIKIEWEE